MLHIIILDVFTSMTIPKVLGRDKLSSDLDEETQVVLPPKVGTVEHYEQRNGMPLDSEEDKRGAQVGIT